MPTVHRPSCWCPRSPSVSTWVVEGAEGGGFKNADGASTLVLVPEIAKRFDVPIIAAGGIVDGPSMAAALAMGADGVQMGTRMVASAESPIHDNWKQSIVNGSEADTVMVNRHHRPAMRVFASDKARRSRRRTSRPPSTSTP